MREGRRQGRGRVRGRARGSRDKVMLRLREAILRLVGLVREAEEMAGSGSDASLKAGAQHLVRDRVKVRVRVRIGVGVGVGVGV